MDRFLPLCLGLLALGTASAVPTYLCQRADGPIVVDGALNEPVWGKAAELSPFRDLSGRPSDYTVRLKMTYDDTYLYFGAVLPTSHLRARQTERDSIIYHDDDFEIFIDPTCTGKNYLELEINALNTVWDLMLTAPYRDGKACIAFHDWDIKKLRHAVTLQGTLNDDRDTDTSWTVEIAWPWESLTHHGELPRRGAPPAPGTEMRFNFSRVDHPTGAAYGEPGYSEVNTVWAPTRQVTIHAPEQWGRVRFSDKTVGTPEAFPPFVGLWVHGNDARLTPADVRRWKAAGITALVVDGTDANRARVLRWAKEAGLEAIAWMWTLNRPDDAEALTHADWYAVSAEGKSCFLPEDRPFVPYYQFLCPSSTEVRDYLCGRVPTGPETDAVQMDYIRLPDVVLPVALWETYGLDMSETLPPYDFCYCERCVSAFGGNPDPDDPAWREARLRAVAETANGIAGAARAAGKPCGAAVFPTPRLSAEMVRQDWSRFDLDFAFPMTYASFYNEDEDWILDCVTEAREAVNGRFPIYPGLHLPDFEADGLEAFLPRLLSANPQGFCLFSHEELTPERLEALTRALQVPAAP